MVAFARWYVVCRPVALVRERAPSYGAGEDAAARKHADAPDDLDAIEALGDEIATLAAHIHAATHRLLTLLTDFDARRGWELDGHRSCAHWLAFRTGIDLGAAREKVRAARALGTLPETSAAMARGELSFSQLRALTRVATPDNESDLVELARGCTTAQLERIVRGWKAGSARDEAERERLRHESRTFSLFHGDDGMVVVRGRLTPEVGALLMRAIEAAADALYREEAHSAERLAGCSPPPRGSTPDTLLGGARRRADALSLLAERALEAGFGRRGDSTDGDGETDPGKSAAEPVPVSGTRAARYQVVLHVDADTLATTGVREERGNRGEWGEDGTPHGSAPSRSHLDDGTRVSAETSRRIACDAALVRVTHAPDGSVLDVGRRTRTIPPALRRALDARDGGCRFPGCGSRFCEAHHVRHWGEGGETSLSNTLLACRVHHRLLHEGGWRVAWSGEGEPIFLDPRGGMHYEARPRLPAHALPDDPVSDLVAEHTRLGIRPDWRTAGARWKREDDVPRPIYLRALEAAG